MTDAYVQSMSRSGFPPADPTIFSHPRVRPLVRVYDPFGFHTQRSIAHLRKESAVYGGWEITCLRWWQPAPIVRAPADWPEWPRDRLAGLHRRGPALHSCASA